MKYVEAPVYADPVGPSIFLAGGITNCEDWQKYAVDYFTRDEVTIYNPRRADFDITDPTATEKQIKWEFTYLSKADRILFWFPGGESVQPITLYELGRYAALGKRLIVGADPEYLRREDVVTQMKLARPDLYVWDKLSMTCLTTITSLQMDDSLFS